MRKKTILHKCIFVYILLICNVFNSVAQETKSPIFTNRATLFGVGSANLYDTYLSPLKYTGTSFRIIDERMKSTSWFNNKFTRQQTIELEFAMADSPAKNVNEYWGMIQYGWGGHYNIVKTDKFRFSAGAIWKTSVGVLYNERNGNNPASARVHSNINLSAIGFYNFKNLTFRWQLDTPVIGALFSPQYGQSYYEMSLGNTVGVANFASLHNQRALRNFITVDIPINKVMLRVGYQGSYYQTKVHNLQTHTYTNSFVIGMAFESFSIRGNKMKDKDVNSSFY